MSANPRVCVLLLVVVIVVVVVGMLSMQLTAKELTLTKAQ